MGTVLSGFTLTKQINKYIFIGICKYVWKELPEQDVICLGVDLKINVGTKQPSEEEAHGLGKDPIHLTEDLYLET